MKTRWNLDWPRLKTYDQDHLARIALPLGGIGTGTVSLGGRGDLRDWEIMNRPAKGFVPHSGRSSAPSFVLFARRQGTDPVTRLLEGPLELEEYEGGRGSPAPNHGLPRFREAEFAAAYPFGQVALSDPAVPVTVRIEAFNPFVPADPDTSGIPVAALRFVLRNRTARPVTAAVCGSLPNFIGRDGTDSVPNPGGHNEFKTARRVRGIAMRADGVPADAPTRGTLALTTTARDGVSYRTAWKDASRWGAPLLDFWDDFSADGAVGERTDRTDRPMGSLAVRLRLAPREERAITFLVTWHFPNRYTWSPGKRPTKRDNIGNFYTHRWEDAWQVAEWTAARLPRLETVTSRFVSAFCEQDLPPEVKEAALFNLSTLRSQTCFRTPDGNLYGWEGCDDRSGCCPGSCTHVWNYEQATPFLFGDLARRMRDVEFRHATDRDGRMSFRVNLPLSRARGFGRAAADGQMGCLMKLYRDWQLSGDDAWLRRLWPKARKALEFCWIEGGWDADRDGVMEGCQHNTMDVEYLGPNPQMGVWYLGALRAAEEMARHIGDDAFAAECRALFERGRSWLDENLFNGEYYEHHVRPIKDPAQIAEGLDLRWTGVDPAEPDYQLGAGCLVDQLVGQYMAHITGLGYLLKPANVRKTMRAIMKYNRRTSLAEHFNCLRSFALGDEAALLMAAYPQDRPDNPFPYFTEVMTGFEYTAAAGMLQEGQTANGLQCIRDIRARYDGRRRNPFDEAECGHHYARAMASWAAVTTLTGFHYSAVTGVMQFAANEGPATWFWSTGDAWGTFRQDLGDGERWITLEVMGGKLALAELRIGAAGSMHLPGSHTLSPGAVLDGSVHRS